MKEPINEQNAEQVSGGRYYLNSNNRKLVFTTQGDSVFVLQNCTDYEAMELMDSFIGKFSTMEQYDQACINALHERGWIA